MLRHTCRFTVRQRRTSREELKIWVGRLDHEFVQGMISLPPPALCSCDIEAENVMIESAGVQQRDYPAVVEYVAEAKSTVLTHQCFIARPDHHPPYLGRQAKEVACLHQAQLDQRICSRHCGKPSYLRAGVIPHVAGQSQAVLDEERTARVGLEAGSAHCLAGLLVDTQNHYGVLVSVEQVWLDQCGLQLWNVMAVGCRSHPACRLEIASCPGSSNAECE